MTCGRYDVHYAVCSLSRFQVAPREGHLKLAEKALGYLKKYKKRGFVINPEPPTFSVDFDNEIKLEQDFGSQYHYFKEEMDPKVPRPTRA